MFVPDLVVRSRRVVTTGGIRPAAIHVRNGRIIGIVGIDDVPWGSAVDDAGDDVVLPGLVDTSVELNASGQSEPHCYERTTRAAALGGVTTIVAAPFGGDTPITGVAAMEARCHSAEGHCFVDVGFWGAIHPGNADQLEALFRAGVHGFRCTLASSDEDGAIAVTETDLRGSLQVLARVGAPLLAHAEIPGPIEAASAHQRAHSTWRNRLLGFSPAARRYNTFLDTHPKAAEDEAVALLIRLCEAYRLPTHVVSLSSSDALAPIFNARSKRLSLSADTSPHHLLLVAEDIPNGATEYKTLPPIRGRENREFLWAALRGGLIQSVVSAHRAVTRAKTSSNFLKVPWGIASLHLGLSIVWTEACARNHTLEHVVQWMCRSPAQLARLHRKGSIDVGCDADLVIFDPDAEFTVQPQEGRDGPTATPYRARRLRGKVKRTYLRGARVDNTDDAASARGRLIFGGGRRGT